MVCRCVSTSELCTVSGAIIGAADLPFVTPRIHTACAATGADVVQVL